MLAFDRESIVLRVSAPGDYLVKVSYSPYWQVAAGDRHAHRPAATISSCCTPRAAAGIELRIVVTPHGLWDELAIRIG